jgi:hypothetical protein
LTDGFKTLGQGIAGVISVMGIMRTMDFIQNISKATNEIRDLGRAMDLPVSRMDAIARGFTAAGISADGMINKIRSIRYTLTDSWGYGTETAYRWGISGGDNKSDDEIADQIAAKAERMSPRKRDRFLRDMGITDPTEQRWFSDSKYRKEMRDNANSGIRFTDDQLNELADLNKEYKKLQVHVDGVSKSFALGAAGGMTKFYEGLKKILLTPEVNKFADRIGMGFAGAFEAAGNAMERFAESVQGYKPLNDMLDAMQSGDVGGMSRAFGDMWKDFKEVVTASDTWKGMTDALKGIAVEVGHLMGQGFKQMLPPMLGGGTDEERERYERETGTSKGGDFGEYGNKVLTPEQEAAEEAQRIGWMNLLRQGSLESASKMDLPSTGFLDQSTQVLNPNPVPIKQDISNDVSVQTFIAAPGQTFEEAVEDLRLKPTLQPYNQVR